ncbi:hypothetical protein GCM10009811_14170 [Nostocoides veronense]|uniref:Uncharacterized protein n=2 Tax=Nostocoides veronense TaxID=330836 RepID=A0ABN2LJ66_9MICO
MCRMSGYQQIPVPERSDGAQPARRGTPQCPWCGETGFEPGFIEDTGQAAKGFARWIPGEMNKGIFGGAARFGRERMDINGQRCLSCGFLALFASYGS